jgi:hypothetical protein
MANFNKSFNFRNGVQVDNDHFIVNANGLVGIGSTVPTQALDVSGNINVSGFVTAPNIFTRYLNVSGVGTVATLKTGIITSTNPGFTNVVYYGDGSNLVNIPTSQWVNIDVGLGFTSIYARGYVGIVTTDPRFALQVGNNPQLGQSGVGIDSTGNIKATGIITANSFSGSGQNITAISANNITSGTLSNTALPPYISVSGIITATGGFRGNITGIASTALTLSGTPSISVRNITANSYYSTGILTTSTINSGIITTTSINSGFSTTGISTVHRLLYIPTLGSIGVGTNLPNADIHIRDGSNGASLQLTSDGNNETYVSIGRSVTRNGNNGELRFGNTNSSYLYSSPDSLDIINYGIGNVNNYLQFGSSGIGTGSFNWLYGQSYNTSLMTLTYGGSLGIGITLPTNTLHVVGTSTVTGDSYIGGSLSVSNNFTAGGIVIANGGISNANITGTLTGSLFGNVYGAIVAGISTFNEIKSQSTASFLGNVGIGTTTPNYPLQLNTTINTVNATRFIVNTSGAIGVGTNIIASGGVLVDSSQGLGIFQGVGIGTITPKSYADFASAGAGVAANAYRFMLPPKITTTQRNSLTVVEGAFIYNTSNKRLEIYNGNGWSGIATIV